MESDNKTDVFQNIFYDSSNYCFQFYSNFVLPDLPNLNESKLIVRNQVYLSE